MTATQVFLRFIENEYMNADGSINVEKLKLWRYELRNNRVSSKLMPYSITKRCRKSKNFVDDYLCINKLTLNGFIIHFFEGRRLYNYWYLYGRNYTATERNLSKRWRNFLMKHINESDCFKKRWNINKTYIFTWKE